MDELASWILLPLVVVLASWGTGLLVERVFRTELPDGLVLPLGFAEGAPGPPSGGVSRTELRDGLVLPLGFAATMVLLSVPYRLGASAAVATPLMMLPIGAGFWLARARALSALPPPPVALAALA